MMDGKKLTEMDLPFLYGFVEKKALKHVSGP